MLASDLNNPEFVGAKNGDEMLSVEFTDYAAVDLWASAEKGHKVLKKECPFIRISVPGQADKLDIFRPAEGADVKRFPKQWMYYQMQTGKIAMADDVVGWKLKDWDELNDEQIRHLNHLRFYTVEQLAAASDQQVAGIGLGAQGLKARAIRALEAKNASVAAGEIAKRDEQIKAQAEQLAAQGAELKELRTMLESLVTPKRKQAEREAA